MTALPPELAAATPVELAIAKLELRPGDVLVIQPGFRVDNDTARRIVEWAKGILPEGAKCMVVEPGTDLTVIRRESAPPAEGFHGPDSRHAQWGCVCNACTAGRPV